MIRTIEPQAGKIDYDVDGTLSEIGLSKVLMDMLEKIRKIIGLDICQLLLMK